MKKIVSIILLITILLGLVPIVNAETTDNVTFTVDKTTANIGDTVTVTLKTSQEVEAVDFSINYSQDIFEFISTSISSDDMYDDKGDRVQICAYNTKGFDTFTFSFKAKSKGIATFSTDIDALNIDQTGTNQLPFENKTINVTVNELPPVVEVTSVTLDKTTASVEVGKTTTLTATVAPTDATDKTVTWTSSDTNVATVSNGVITGVKVGTATITAKAGEKTATCTVTVAPSEDKTDDENKTVEVTTITLDKTTDTLKVGDTLNLTATVKPDNATDKTVTWKSSDTSIATVTNGTVKAIKEGTVTITASVGSKSATCKITITNKTDSNNNNNNSNENNNKDNTTATKPIPQTGETLTIAGIVIATISVAIISIIKYRKYRDI